MAALEFDPSKFTKSCYEIDAKLIPRGSSSEEETIYLNRCITELRVVKDFRYQKTPYCRMELAVSKSMADEIRKNWRTATLWLSVKRQEVPIGGSEPSDRTPNDTLEYFIENKAFRIMTTSLDSPAAGSNDIDYETSDAANVQDSFATIEIAPLIPLAIEKQLICRAYHDVSVQDVVSAVVSETLGGLKETYRVWFNPSNNDREYENILIPPLSFVQCLKYLDSRYGIYGGRLVIFLDFDDLLILNADEVMIGNDEAALGTIIEIRDLSNQSLEVSSGGAFDPESRTYTLYPISQPEIKSSSAVINEVLGDHVLLIRSTQAEVSGGDCKNVFSETADNHYDSSESGKKQVVAWQRYDNPLTMDKLKAERREIATAMTLIFTGCNTAAFNPRYHWWVRSQGDRLGSMEGNWKLESVEFIFTCSASSAEPADLSAMARFSPVAPKE